MTGGRTVWRRLGTAAALLALAAGMWLAATWPVAKEFGRAIPYTDKVVVSQRVVPLWPGDHLQLLYHCWLGLDALQGNSPFGTNVYEFNLGTDEGHEDRDWYYLPFSAVYMALAGWLGHAAAWNAAQMCAGVLGTLFLALWARRFTRGWGAAALAAAVAGAVSYRWVTLLCGSPTGFGMAFPPMLAWGLDRGARGGEKAGWGWAVAAMACSYASDLHTFYFSGLAAPFLLGMSLWRSADERGGWGAAARVAWGSFRALWPLWAVLGAAGLAGVWVVHRGLSRSVMKTGRTLFEMAHYSPPPEGVVSRRILGMGRHAYLGWPLLALAVASAGLATASGRDAGRGGRWRRAAPWVGLAACAGVVLLGLGIHAPPFGIWARAARKLVPGYGMIRQTVKVYSVLPALLAAPLAGCFSAIFEEGGRGWRRRAARWTLALLAAWAAADGLMHTEAGLTVLPPEDEANLAIAADAEDRGDETPGALAVPLWPGDSHWSSLYEYATMLRGARWVNGYSAMTPEGYDKNVYERFASINQGVADDAQLDALLAMEVRYLEVFPSAFPDKVSPWPPGVTVRRLMEHPRLAPVWDDDDDGRKLLATFAFRILAPGETRGRRAANWTDAVWGASWHWKFAEGATNVPPGGTCDLLLRAPVADAEGRRVEFRVSPGSAWPRGQERGGDRRNEASAADWLPEWESVPMEAPLGEVLEATEEGFSLEHAFVAAGRPWEPDGDGAWSVTPALMWHGGLMRPGRPEVRFESGRTMAGVALYGPQLPVPAGRYACEAEYAAAPDEESGEEPGPDETVGCVRVASYRTGRVYAEAPMFMGGTSVRFETGELPSEPIRLEVVYRANAELTVRALRLRPLP